MKNKNGAALFDLDGTLINSSAERLFLRYLINKGKLGFCRIVQPIPTLFSNLFSVERGILQNKFLFAGVKNATLRELAFAFFTPIIDSLIPHTMRQILGNHRRAGRPAFLLTGTIDCIAEIFVQKFGFYDCRATRLEDKGGILTGRIDGLHPFGIRKAILLDQLQLQYGFDKKQSYYYGNHGSDRFVMEKVGNPVAVNPDKLLERTARNKRWSIVWVGYNKNFYL